MSYLRSHNSSPSSSKSSLDLGAEENDTMIPLYHRTEAPVWKKRPTSRIRKSWDDTVLWWKRRSPRFKRYAPPLVGLLVVTLVLGSVLGHRDGVLKHDGVSVNPGSRPGGHEIGNSLVWDSRANKVKAAFVHAYGGYQSGAFPMDELLPLTHHGVNNFNGWGVSIVDSVDTMIIMGLQPQYYEKALAAMKSLDLLNSRENIGFFETVIRYLGGFLSAYALTGDGIWKQRADELGQILLPAFDSLSGLPTPGVRLEPKYPNHGWVHHSGLAEMASFQLEFKYLARITGKKVYYQKAQTVNNILAAKQDKGSGMFADVFNNDDGHPRGAHWSVGAASDSAYEYLLKQYLLTAKSEPKALEMYINSVNGVLKNLLYISRDRKLLYVTDATWSTPTHTFEHLSCFYPGLLALGVMTLSLTETDKHLHMSAARGLADTCYLSYRDQISGLGPDIMRFDSSGTKWLPEYDFWLTNGATGPPPGVWGTNATSSTTNRDYSNSVGNYLLRPETVETFFVMYRVTGEEMWRDRGWEIFQAIEAKTKTTYGYASVYSVDTATPQQSDSQPSYYLAETLKYLYLLFQNDAKLISLEEYVFNTEGHPLPIFEWSAQEIADLGVDKMSL